MNLLLSSLGDTPAGEGIGGAVMAIIAVLGTFALIYAILEIMDKIRKKKENDPGSGEVKAADKKEFIDVLAEKMQEKEDKQNEENRSGHA